MVLQCNNGVGSNPVEGRTKNLTALKSNSNTVWFNFQTYIYIYIYPTIGSGFIYSAKKANKIFWHLKLFFNKLCFLYKWKINDIKVYAVGLLCIEEV